MNESQEHEMTLAIAWYDGKYTAKQAERSADIQGIDFTAVQEKYGRLYARYEAMGR